MMNSGINMIIVGRIIDKKAMVGGCYNACILHLSVGHTSLWSLLWIKHHFLLLQSQMLSRCLTKTLISSKSSFHGKTCFITWKYMLNFVQFSFNKFLKASSSRWNKPYISVCYSWGNNEVNKCLTAFRYLPTPSTLLHLRPPSFPPIIKRTKL